MKVTYRIPAKEQYGYIEMELEVASVEDALEGYENTIRAYKGGEGLSDKEFNDCLDRYLGGDKKMTSDCYERMNEVQKVIVQSIKRSYKRINKE